MSEIIIGEREFQSRSADYIYERLFVDKGREHKRFLLADEVGLGKTIIAQFVLHRFFKNTPGHHTILYICSNTDIADQNVEKLAPKENVIRGSRLTLLRLQLPEKRKNLVISLTPGTSINITKSTGRKEERKFLYYLLRRFYKVKRKHRALLIEYLRCSARADDWKGTRWYEYRHNCSRHTNREFRKKLKRVWEKAVRDAHFIEDPKSIYYNLIGTIIYLARTFNEKDRRDRNKRNRMIGLLRQELAKVVLEELKPKVVILDEFQRFKDMLDVLSEGSIEKKLLDNPNIAFLLLSATPYKMYTLRGEDEDHYRDFKATLRFLYGNEADKQLKKLDYFFNEHREKIEKLVTGGEAAIKKTDEELYAKKLKIEKLLKTVMIRTERCIFFENLDTAIVEHGIEDKEVPGQNELEEYLFLSEAIKDIGISRHALLEYWKSGQYLLNFMDENYELIRKIDKRGLFREAKKKKFVFTRNMINIQQPLKLINLKLKKLIDLTIKLLGEHKALWIPPMYRYYCYDKHEQESCMLPRKFLIFSSWKFVPKFISMVLSYQLEASLKKRGVRYYNQNARRPLLQFRVTGNKLTAFSLFNIFYPSLFLAKEIDPLEIVKSRRQVLMYKDLAEQVKKKLKVLLTNHGVSIVPGRKSRMPVFEIMLYLDAKAYEKIDFGKVFKDRTINKEITRSEMAQTGYNKYAEAIVEKLGDIPGKITISVKDLDSLAKIAMHSPSVCLVRTALRLLFKDKYDKITEEDIVQCLKASLVTLRNYFNKYWVREVIDNSISRAGKRFYWERILEYCAKQHFQEVFDEFGYLLKQSIMIKSNLLKIQKPGELLKDFFKDLDNVLSLKVGTPTYYSGEKAKRGNIIRCHYAMAFGDQSTEGIGEVVRRSQVREAFNSPFWPFVLITTSVGQEGLDFHRYCNDVLHWNLPSNPIDLEQREGRVNRYDAIVVRKNIAKDFPLIKVIGKYDKNNLWDFLLKYIEENTRIENKLKQGIAPHWLYQCSRNPEKIRRYVFLHGFSKDRQKYESLKKHLIFYRLAFGQPRQEDLVSYLSSKVKTNRRIIGYFPTYTINLSPDYQIGARNRARRFAMEYVKDKKKVKRLLRETRHNLIKGRKIHEDIEGHYKDLMCRLKKWCDSKQEISKKISEKNLIRMLSALIYFIDPFDEYSDRYWPIAFDDDIEYLEEMMQKCGFDIKHRCTVLKK